MLRVLCHSSRVGKLVNVVLFHDFERKIIAVIGELFVISNVIYFFHFPFSLFLNW